VPAAAHPHVAAAARLARAPGRHGRRRRLRARRARARPAGCWRTPRLLRRLALLLLLLLLLLVVVALQVLLAMLALLFLLALLLLLAMLLLLALLLALELPLVFALATLARIWLFLLLLLVFRHVGAAARPLVGPPPGCRLPLLLLLPTSAGLQAARGHILVLSVELCILLHLGRRCALALVCRRVAARGSR
jgi:hypothetical protein